MLTPRVSIIIPSYNHRAFIGALIKSIYEQTFKDLELIVLDDGSKDGSPEYLQELSSQYGFQLVIKENEGLCATLNRGLALAKGEFIINIGSDDIIPPERISEQVAYMDSHPDVDVVAGCMDLINEAGEICGYKKPAVIGNVIFKEMLVINRVLAPTAMIRATVFKRFGNYPENYVLEDYYLWLKILNNGGKIHNTSKNWAFYRIVNTNLEKKFNWYYKGNVQVLSPYRANFAVARQMDLNQLIYCIKLCLLLGANFKEKYSDIYKNLSFLERALLGCLGLIPKRLRFEIMSLLKLKT